MSKRRETDGSDHTDRPMRGQSGRRLLPIRLNAGAVWGLAAALFLVLEIFAAVGASLLTSYNPLTGDLERRLLAPGSAGHLLGTDQLGRDLLARMLYGARISLVVGVVAVVVAGGVGVLAGLFMAFRGGWLDSVGSRIVDVQLSFPFMALALSIAALLGAPLLPCNSWGERGANLFPAPKASILAPPAAPACVRPRGHQPPPCG